MEGITDRFNQVLTDHNDKGVKLRRYQLLTPLGEGGEGSVYSALDEWHHSEDWDTKYVAIKLLESSIPPDRVKHNVRRFSEEAGIFLQEALTLDGLEHSNIIKLLNFGVDWNLGVFYMVMRRATGSLKDSIMKRRCIDPKEAVNYTMNAASALQFTHEHGTIHGDVKPGNLLFFGIENWILLSDFGIARIKQEIYDKPERNFKGTPGYSPPEQVKGEPTKLSDQWALAFTISEALTGKRPFTQENLLALAAGKNVSPLSFKELGITDAVHLEMEKILRRGLEPKQDERFPEISNFSEQLTIAYTSTTTDPAKHYYLSANLSDKTVDIPTPQTPLPLFEIAKTETNPSLHVTQ
ncbi:MAG TPA: serine/threonine-protein kinase [Patescibacteria group bacterium]|nr:serine/threonine-protein kinase [Patescibacteria group bacterium]